MEMIAEKSGVSKATVSRALGGSRLIGERVRSHVEKVAAELGYIRRKQKRHAERAILTVKVVLPASENQSTQLFYSFLTLIDGLREGLKPSVANVIVETLSENYSPFPHKKGGEVDAFVFAFHRPSQKVVAEIEDREAACVVLDRLASGVRQVVSDHHDAMVQIAGHLSHQGVRGRCCFVNYQGIADIAEARLRGFGDGAKKNGISFDPVVDRLEVDTPEALTLEKVRALYESGVRHFVGFNDVVGIILSQHLQSLGLSIPDQVKVTGCGGGPIHDITRPRLTTIDMCLFKLVREVGRSLQAEVVQREEAQSVLELKGNLIVGETT